MDNSELTNDQVAFLKDVDTATLANAIELLEVRDRTEGYIGGSVACNFTELPPMVGHAVTATVTNVRGGVGSRKGYWDLWQTLQASAEPAVLILQDSSGSPERCAYFGGIMARLASRLGAVGLVTDGGVRDLPEMRGLGFHVFAPYSVPSHGNFEVSDVGIQVSIAGQTINPGDLLHGDVNGVITFPTDVLVDLPMAIVRIREREKHAVELLSSPRFSLPAFQALESRR